MFFAYASGRVGATITFVSNIPGETQTLPSAIYTFTQVPGGESGALRLTLVSIALAFAAMIASELLAPARGADGPRRLMLSVGLRTRLGELALDVAFAADDRVTALFGRSGAGKTSVVNCIAGLLRPEHGRIVFDGEPLLDTEAGIDVPRHRRRVGYVFQDSAAVPAPDGPPQPPLRALVRPARQPPHWPRRGRGAARPRRPTSPWNGRFIGWRETTRRHRPCPSSSCQLLLMDEPLSSLDTKRKQEVMPFLERLRDQAGIPIVYVSHVLAEVEQLSGKIVLMSAGKVVSAEEGY